MVTKPAEAAGLELEPGLVDRLITDVGAGRDPGALPRLAHALRETWHNRSGNRLTLNGYQRDRRRRPGGRADRGRRVRTGSPSPTGGRCVPRCCAWSPCSTAAASRAGGRTAPRCRPGSLESLVAARLVTVDRDHVPLSHDALLTAWPRLREWVDEDRQGLLVRQQLARGGGRLASRRPGPGRPVPRRAAGRRARLVGRADRPHAGRAGVPAGERAGPAAADPPAARPGRRARHAAGPRARRGRRRGDRPQRRRAGERRTQPCPGSWRRSRSPRRTSTRSAPCARPSQAGDASPTAEARGALLSAPMLTYPAAFSSGVRQRVRRRRQPRRHAGRDRLRRRARSCCGTSRSDKRARRRHHRAPGTVAGGEVLPGRHDARGLLRRPGDPTTAACGSGRCPSGKLVSRLADADPAIGPVAWRPDGTAVAATSLRPDGTAWVGEWDPTTGNADPLGRDRSRRPVQPRLQHSRPTGSRSATATAASSCGTRPPARRVSTSTDHRDARRPTRTARAGAGGGLRATCSRPSSVLGQHDPAVGPEHRRARAGVPGHHPARHRPRPGTDGAGVQPGRRVAVHQQRHDRAHRLGPVDRHLPAAPCRRGRGRGTTVGNTVLAIAVSRDGRTRVAASTATAPCFAGTPTRAGHRRRPARSPASPSTPTASGSRPGTPRAAVHLGHRDRRADRRAASTRGGVFGLRYTRTARGSPAPATPPSPSTTPRARDRSRARSPSPAGSSAAPWPCRPDGKLARRRTPAGGRPTSTERGQPDPRLGRQDARPSTRTSSSASSGRSTLLFSPDGDTLLALTSTRAPASRPRTRTATTRRT